jgi:hypothetical protein
MIDVHVWFNGGNLRVTIPMNDGDTVADLKQVIDSAQANTPLSGVGVGFIAIWDHATGNLVPDGQQLNDDDEFDATLANGAAN